jgi:hypothetical protein
MGHLVSQGGKVHFVNGADVESRRLILPPRIPSDARRIADAPSRHTVAKRFLYQKLTSTPFRAAHLNIQRLKRLQ